MTKTGFSDVDASGRSGELVDYLTLVARHAGEMRRAGHDMLRLRPGQAVLDVGCGAGEVCVELAARVGAQGQVAGVDLSQAMIDAARANAVASGAPIDLRVGSVYALPFADGTFDAVRAERVFQHLDDPEAALREMIRVTRRGGRIVVVDPDHGQAGLGLDEPAHRRVFDALQRAMLRMIANPHSGTRLRGMFVRAGLMDIAHHALAPEFTHSHYLKMFFVGERLDAAEAAGEITAAERAAFTTELLERHRNGTFFCNALAYTMAGTKP